MGASLARAVHQRELAAEIRVWARRPEVRLKLAEEPWCHEVFAAPEMASSEAQLVVVCTPVGQIPPLVEQIRHHVPEGCIVTDVGSVKSFICRQGHATLGERAFFIGSHPMAGSEKSGMEHADETLFGNRPCFVTPLDVSDPEATEKVVAFWQALDADVTTLSPEKHDEIVAHISHLPHILASTLCSFLGLKDPAWQQFAGAGLKDTTRIAGGNPEMWREILQQNQEEIRRAISRYQDELEAFQAALANEDYYQARYFLERGKAYRDHLL